MHRWLTLTILTTWLICGQSAEVPAKQSGYCADSTRSVLFLIDRTTAYDERDQDVLVDGLDRFFKELEAGDRLLLYTIGGSAADSRRLFDDCVPGCPETGLFDGLFSSCKPIVARADRQDFTRKLLAILLDLLKNNVHYDASAILETIRNTLKTNKEANVSRLVVFSDMLENSDVLTLSSLVRDGPDLALQRVERLNELPEATDVDVDVFGTGRSHAAGRPPLATKVSRDLEMFWTNVFRQGGASHVAIGPEYAPGGT